MRRISLLALAFLAGLALATSSPNNAATAPDAHARSDAFWSLSWLRAMEAERFSSLQEMAGSVDAIVEGRVSVVRPSRDLSNPNGREVARYAAVTITVERTIKGSVGGTIDLEVFFSSTRRYDAFLSSALPTETSLYFIRNKGTVAEGEGKDAAVVAAARPYNMLVNLSQSLFRNIGGLVHTTDSGEGGFTTAWEGRPFVELVAALAN